MFYKAGDFRHQITIQSSTVTTGTFGGKSDSWATHSTGFAKIESMTGREYQGQGQVKSDTTHKFWIRQNKDKSTITTKMRISFNSRTFDIQSVIDPDETDNVLIIMGKERG